MQLEEYKRHALKVFFQQGANTNGAILEIGSDLEARVVREIASRTRGEVFGLNPHPEFPILESGIEIPERIKLIREDGRKLPFANESFDAIFCVATSEHVIGLDQFYSEIKRVLKPGGLFHTDFEPLWSCAIGHHVAVKRGDKEARFWKPGRNPIPNFAHLLWTPNQMREFLKNGPCSNDLVEPIVQWIYFEDGVNRCFLEEHLAALDKCGLLWQRQYLRCHTHLFPLPEEAMQLKAKYGNKHDFYVAGVEATLRKRGSGIGDSKTRLRKVYNDCICLLKDLSFAARPHPGWFRPLRNYRNRTA